MISLIARQAVASVGVASSVWVLESRVTTGMHWSTTDWVADGLEWAWTCCRPTRI